MKVRIDKYNRDKQRVKVKLHRYDTWSLDVTLAHIILPALKQFRKTSFGRPPALSQKEWEDSLDKMIWSFRQITRYRHTAGFNQGKVQEGLDLFSKWYLDLWQ